MDRIPKSANCSSLCLTFHHDKDFLNILAISVLTKTIIIWLWRHNKNHWYPLCSDLELGIWWIFERKTLIFQHKKFRFDIWPCDTPINIDQISCKGNHCTKQTPDWPWAYQGVCLFEEGMGEWEGGVPCCHSGEFMVSYIQMGRDGSIIAIPMLAKVMDPVNKNDNSYRNSKFILRHCHIIWRHFSW